MKLWFTTQELADAVAEGLFEGLPRTRRAIDFYADRNGWDKYPALCRKRAGSEGGGGREYHIELLPLAMRLDYASRFLVVTPADAQPSIPEDDDLTAAARRERDAKLAILAVADRFRASTTLSQAASDDLFARLYAGGKVEIAAWVRLTKPDVSARSLARWRETMQRQGTGALGYDASQSRKGTGTLDRANKGEVRDFMLGLIAGNQFLSAEHIRNAVIAKFGPRLWSPVAGASLDLQREVEVPPVRAFQRALAAWRKAYRPALEKISDPDGYRSRTEFVATGTTVADRLNELWQIDASPLDALLVSGRRPNIYAAIDIYSRRVMILVTATPRAEGVGLLIRKCLMAWGVPERIKTDNGSDFRAHATERLLTALRIGVEYSPPYSPRSKGVIERAIGTFQRDFAATLPGFVGHSVADRRIIENRKSFAARLGSDDAGKFHPDLNEAEIAAWCDRWAADIYATTPHDGLGGRTPREMAAYYQGPVRRIEGHSGLDVLIAPIAGTNGRRTVTKTGIRVDGENYLIGTVMPGTEVFCRRDPADLGRLYVFAADEERFLGHAICPALAGLDPARTIARVRAEQKAVLEGQLKPIRAAMRKIGPRQVAEAQLRAGASRGEIIPFHPAEQQHSTPGLDAAAAAAAPIAAEPFSEGAAVRHAELVRDIAAAGNVRQLAADTKETRFRRAREIEAQIAAGAEMRAADVEWLEGYRGTPEYRAMKRFAADFGDSVSL